MDEKEDGLKIRLKEKLKKSVPLILSFITGGLIGLLVNYLEPSIIALLNNFNNSMYPHRFSISSMLVVVNVSISSPWIVSSIIREKRIIEIMPLLAFFMTSADISLIALMGDIGLALFIETMIILGFVPFSYEKIKEYLLVHRGT